MSDVKLPAGVELVSTNLGNVYAYKEFYISRSAVGRDFVAYTKETRKIRFWGPSLVSLIQQIGR